MVIVREYVKRILKSFEKDTYLHKRCTFHCAKIQKKLRIKAYDKLFLWFFYYSFLKMFNNMCKLKNSYSNVYSKNRLIIIDLMLL